jgi:hypothetical protein
MRPSRGISEDSPALRPRTYIVYCAWACLSPVALVLVRLASGAPAPASSQDDMMFALLGTFMASLFTYPSGVVGTIVSCAAAYSGLLTPTEAVLLATPVYVGAGYLQWYVLIPRYFRAGSRRGRQAPRRAAGDASI